MNKRQSDEVQVAVMAKSIQNIEEKVTNIDNRLGKDYVTNDKLQLTVEKVSRLEKLVYGCVGIMLTAIIIGIMAVVVRKP